jgi:hypothetical protein
MVPMRNTTGRCACRHVERRICRPGQSSRPCRPIRRSRDSQPTSCLRMILAPNTDKGSCSLPFNAYVHCLTSDDYCTLAMLWRAAQ